MRASNIVIPNNVVDITPSLTQSAEGGGITPESFTDLAYWIPISSYNEGSNVWVDQVAENNMTSQAGTQSLIAAETSNLSTAAVRFDSGWMRTLSEVTSVRTLPVTTCILTRPRVAGTYDIIHSARDTQGFRFGSASNNATLVSLTHASLRNTLFDLSINSWSFWVVVWKTGDIATVYKNGVSLGDSLVGSKEASGFVLGATEAGANNAACDIADFFAYNRILTTEEIESLDTEYIEATYGYKV